MSRNPWDILQTLRKTCRGDAPPPRKDSYLPYLVVRTLPGDHGQRPLPDGTVFWESPDIFVVPNQAVQSSPSVPVSLGGMAQAGVPNTLYAHVWNLGRAPAFDVRVEFYWFNPTLGIEESDANLVGFTYVSLGHRNSNRNQAIVRCPVEWVPTYLNYGHECLVVRAFAPISDPISAGSSNLWSSKSNRHVGQRNIAVLQDTQQTSQFEMTLAPGHSVHDAQVIAVDVPPEDVPWIQLLTGKRQPGLRTPATKPLAGLLPPSAVLQGNVKRPDFSGVSREVLSRILSNVHHLQRAADPLQVTFVAKSEQMAADEAHVVRVQQLHEGKTVGGYTTILKS